MKEDRRLALVRTLTQATRQRKLEWRPLDPGEDAVSTAILPKGERFSLRRAAGIAPGDQAGPWVLEIRDIGDDLLDRIWTDPRRLSGELDAAMGELVAAVEEAAASRLDRTIHALEELTKSPR